MSASIERVTTAAGPPPRQGWAGDLLLGNNRLLGVAAFLALLVLFFALVAQNFLALANANTIALNASILVVVACAEAVVVLTRNYDLSVGSTVALFAYVGLDLVRQLPDLGPVLVVVPMLLGAACGAVNGLLVAYGGIPSVIATLGTMSMFRGLAFLYAAGGQLNAADLPAWVPARRRAASSASPRWSWWLSPWSRPAPSCSAGPGSGGRSTPSARTRPPPPSTASSAGA